VNLDWTGTFLIIVRDLIDLRADRVAPHLAGIVRLQEFRYDLSVIHARIEPQAAPLFRADA
jgi:hypothetical protein